jgi:hypothetical protein
MPRKRVPWSKTVEEAGVRVRVYERAIGSLLYREVRVAGSGKDRKSLGHRDRALAEQQARALARRLGDLEHAGVAGPLTLGQLAALYDRERLPLGTAARARTVRGQVALLVEHFGRDFALEDLSQHHVDAYAAARRSGALRSARHRIATPGVRAGTIRNELHALGAMIEWARSHRTGGRRLLTSDPLAGVVLPVERNMRRPVATEERYRALLAVSSRVDPTGRFRVLLAIARHTGRRRGAICQLRAADVLLSRDQLLRAIGAAGLDLGLADHWPHGAIRWAEATDKLGFEAVAPISSDLRAELDLYLRRHPRVGEAPLVTMATDHARPIGVAYADYWMRKAVRLAELPRLERGGWHTLRRLWASERRHLPAQDVAAAGGWRSLQVMQSAYQHADAATIYQVVESPREASSAPTGHSADTPPREGVRRQQVTNE